MYFTIVLAADILVFIAWRWGEEAVGAWGGRVFSMCAEISNLISNISGGKDYEQKYTV